MSLKGEESKTNWEYVELYNLGRSKRNVCKCMTYLHHWSKQKGFCDCGDAYR